MVIRRPLSQRPVPVQGKLRDEASLRHAYDEHGRELLAFAQRSLGDRGLAEEAVQETFVRAWRAAEKFDPALGSLRTWLFAVCRNIVIDFARARAARPAMVLSGEPVESVEQVGLDRLLDELLVEEALRQLSATHRQVLVEVQLRDRPAAEVAAELHVPVGTIHSRVYYALRAFRVALEELGGLDD